MKKVRAMWHLEYDGWTVAECETKQGAIDYGQKFFCETMDYEGENCEKEALLMEINDDGEQINCEVVTLTYEHYRSDYAENHTLWGLR